MQLSAIYIYPIKSLKGISLSTASLSDRGLQYDRRWMLIDENGDFLTQRQLPAMALIQVELQPGGLRLSHPSFPDNPFTIPYAPELDERIGVEVWGKPCIGQFVSKQANDWLSTVLEHPCKLVYMPEDSHRHVSPERAIHGEIVSFADGYPHLIIGQASLDLLNSKLDSPLPMDRFRPNFVFTGGEAHAEDTWATFRIGNVVFHGVKPCVRCEITTIDQATLERGKEPLRTLASYRRHEKGVIFGQNLLHEGQGTLRIGDKIQVLKLQSA